MSKMRVPKFTLREAMTLLLLGTVAGVIVVLLSVPIWLDGIVGGLIATAYLFLTDDYWRRGQAR